MSRRVQDLQPDIREMCRLFLNKCRRHGIRVFVVHTLRTMEEQALLYAKGRTRPGSVVTRAKPGSSAHNWGLAFDVAFRPKDNPRGVTWVGPWKKVGAIGEELGLAWGGRWRKFPDRPHFQHPRWRELRTKMQMRQDALRRTV